MIIHACCPVSIRIPEDALKPNFRYVRVERSASRPDAAEKVKNLKSPQDLKILRDNSEFLPKEYWYIALPTGENNGMNVKGEFRKRFQEWHKGQFGKDIPVPPCKCRAEIEFSEADELFGRGEALEVWKLKDSRVVLDETRIWKFPRNRVPRVDLTTAINIERAYCEHSRKDIRLIEEVHKMYMANRALLMSPFRPDPFEGRPLLTIFKSEQTSRGVLVSLDEMKLWEDGE